VDRLLASPLAGFPGPATRTRRNAKQPTLGIGLSRCMVPPRPERRAAEVKATQSQRLGWAQSPERVRDEVVNKKDLKP